MAAVPGVGQRVQAAIGRDAVEPGAHGCSLLELLKPAPGRQQGFLEHVFCVLHRAEDPVAVQLQLAPVGVGELAERLPVSRTGAGQRCLGHHGILASPLPFALQVRTPSGPGSHR